uniref:Uncharacterized protein n=1 Tax=Arundo donax TaxID=35708 RepID=A0A0A8YR78_ARUDO
MAAWCSIWLWNASFLLVRSASIGSGGEHGSFSTRSS